VLDSATDAPTHTVEGPVIDVGSGSTVIDWVTKQPVAGSVYEIVAVPTEAPVTEPVREPTDAIDGLPLVQTPPEVMSDKVVDEPRQTSVSPAMPAGSGLTVTVTEAAQPVVSV
jgi:hypothetical protein